MQVDGQQPIGYAFECKRDHVETDSVAAVRSRAMYCYSNFPGDEDQRLFDIQHDSYREALWTIVTAAKERFVDAERVLRCSPTMSVLVHQLKSIDRRTVQDMHDRIAAWYRFRRRSERMFSLRGDVRSDWMQFITREADELCRSADFVTAVLDACIYANKEPGTAGENRARIIQQRRYSEMLQYTLPRPQADEDSNGQAVTNADWRTA